MKRRDFVKMSGAAAALSCLPYACWSGNSSPKFKLGYQLFSIRDEMAKRPLETLEFLKTLGYQDFEHYGFSAEAGTFYGFQPKVFQEKLKAMDLTVSSGHYQFSQFLNAPNNAILDYTKRCIDGALTVGVKYLVWPWLDPDQRDSNGFKKAAAKLNLIGEQINAAGLGLAYHNQGYDFAPLEATTGFDIIVNETDPQLVKLQLDMYWVMHANERSIQELIDADPKRYVMWHIKDLHKISRDYTELGNGSIDYLSILPQLDTSGLEFYYIEQGGNYTVNSKKSAASSATYFKKNLQHHL